VTDLAACQAMLARLNAGGKVTVKELRQVLGERHAENMEAQLRNLTKQREDAAIASAGLREYTKRLQIADLLQSRSDSAKSVASQGSLADKAWYAYEAALEKLVEVLEINPQMHQFLDREMDWGKVAGSGKVTADRDTVPRNIFHVRHVYGNILHRAVSSRAEILEGALTAAIADPQLEPTPPPIPLTDEQSSILKAKLKSIKSV